MYYHSEVYRLKPSDFSPSVTVSACYLYVGDRILLLKRAQNSAQGGTWGVPAGKMEEGEIPIQAAVRELFEETGITLEEDSLTGLGTLYMRYPHIDYDYHLFYIQLEKIPQVTLCDENEEDCWVTHEEALKMPLISGGMQSLHHVQILAGLDRTIEIPRSFYFIRHGETDANRTVETKEVDDSLPLNDVGVQQAKDARRLIEKLPITTVCSSPMLRAQQTKELATGGLDFAHETDPDLGECRAAVWTRMMELEKGVEFDLDPDVERFIKQAVKGVAAATATDDDGSILICSHGGVHWAICYALQVQDHPWKIGNCKIVQFCPHEQKNGTVTWRALPV